MAVDALCNLFSSTLTSTSSGSNGTAFDLKTCTPADGLPIKVKVTGGVTASTATVALSITASDDNFTTTHETLWAKTISYNTTNYSANLEEIYSLQTQRRYIRVVAGNPSATLTTGSIITVDIVTGKLTP